MTGARRRLRSRQGGMQPTAPHDRPQREDKPRTGTDSSFRPRFAGYGQLTETCTAEAAFQKKMPKSADSVGRLRNHGIKSQALVPDPYGSGSSRPHAPFLKKSAARRRKQSGRQTSCGHVYFSAYGASLLLMYSIPSSILDLRAHSSSSSFFC